MTFDIVTMDGNGGYINKNWTRFFRIWGLWTRFLLNLNLMNFVLEILNFQEVKETKLTTKLNDQPWTP